MAEIELRDVSKAFGATRVVRGLSLSVRSGEFLSLLGPSGCGKTTTLRMIAGLEHPDTGTVRIGDEDVFRAQDRLRVPPEKRRLGMVFQSYAVWPHRTVAENVAYPLVVRKLPRSEIAQAVASALNTVRLDGMGDRHPSTLSGGQLQRVALARALVAKPRVLLLDEPLSNLDAALREELRAEIAALRERVSATVIFVTHDQGEALALSDRIAVMNGGVIEQLAAPRELYQTPATAFVARFVGGANVLAGTVRAGSLHVEGIELPLPPSADAQEGAALFAVRAEELALAPDGVALPLETRLFLGHATEYRLRLGGQLLRVVGPDTPLRRGELARIRIVQARRFPT